MRYTQVLINDIDIGDNGNDDTDALVSYDINDSIDDYGIQEKYASINVDYEKYLALIGNFNTGLSCVIKRGDITRTDYTLFHGFITNIEKDSGMVEITARNDFWKTTRIEMTYSYDYNIDDQAGELSAIWEDVVGIYGGLTTSAVASGTAMNLIRRKWPISNKKISDISDEIVKLLGWVQYYKDSDQTVYLEPEGTTAYGTNLVVGENIVNNPVWDDDYESALNVIKVVGSSRRDWSVQTFSGDSSETDFTLIYTPKDTEIYIGSVLQVRGIEGAAVDFDYTVDEQNKKIIFETAPATGTDNITINYSRDVPQAAIARSQDSIDEIGFVSQQTYYIDDLRDMEDIKQKANAILSAFAFGFTNTELEIIDINDLYVGMQITAVDNLSNRTEILTVKEVHYRYPEDTDFIGVGNKRFRITQILNDFKKRLEKLEQQSIASDEFLQHMFDSLRNYLTERRYAKMDIKNIAGDVGIYGHGTFGKYGTAEYGAVTSGGFVLGHTTFGILGTSKIGSGATSPVNISIVQGNNEYKEFLYDTDFKDATSTATWNTTTKELTFTSGQIALTDCIDKGTIKDYFTLTLGSSTGSFTIEISGDNKSTWQTVTPLTRTAFTSNDGTGIYLRITENDSSTGTIKNTYLTNGRYNQPAIKVKLE